MQILPKRIRPLEISQLRLAIWLSVLIRLIYPADVLSQDILAQHWIAALKGLSEISIILRPNAQSEVLSVGEVGDYLEVRVRRRLPELRISPSAAIPMAQSRNSCHAILDRITDPEPSVTGDEPTSRRRQHALRWEESLPSCEG
jgi:hypothetical protein